MEMVALELADVTEELLDPVDYDASCGLSVMHGEPLEPSFKVKALPATRCFTSILHFIYCGPYITIVCIQLHSLDTMINRPRDGGSL